MANIFDNLRQRFSSNQNQQPSVEVEVQPDLPASVLVEPLDIPPTDPLLPYLVNAANPVELEKLTLGSPTLERLREAGVKIAVPLVSQGELIGLLNLGPRLSEQDYSSEDRRLLSNLATQAAPALRVAQLARQQQVEARERERIEQELRVARIIQETLLPRHVPILERWKIDAFWQPAKEVSGDFYDFIPLPDNKMAIIIGDVTDKGVPAALVMATTRTILRATSERLISPGLVLERANELLYPDIPPKMFVTCLYALIDLDAGRLVFANAGHNLPYQQTATGVVEQRATGMPLGLMPGMIYEEKEVELSTGDRLVLSSDGLIEAHNQSGEMYGFPRLKNLVSRAPADTPILAMIMNDYRTFTGDEHEQEDDITLVSLECLAVPKTDQSATEWEQLASFEMPSEPGNERQVALQVIEAIQDVPLEANRRKRLETAVAEAALNAIEHGNRFQADLPVQVEVLRNADTLAVHIRDHGGGLPIPETPEPDLDAKLSGLQSPRGWGLFLIRNMVDEMNLQSDQEHHMVELIVHLDPA